jgi:hypothetical protein
LRFQRADLYVVEGRHKIGSDLAAFSLVTVCVISCSSISKRELSPLANHRDSVTA